MYAQSHHVWRKDNLAIAQRLLVDVQYTKIKATNTRTAAFELLETFSACFCTTVGLGGAVFVPASDVQFVVIPLAARTLTVCKLWRICCLKTHEVIALVTFHSAVLFITR